MVQEISRSMLNFKQAIETVMEEGLQTGEISKKQSAEELASLLLSSYYGFRVLNVSMQNRMLSEQVIKRNSRVYLWRLVRPFFALFLYRSLQ